jgi:hypothetical protein
MGLENLRWWKCKVTLIPESNGVMDVKPITVTQHPHHGVNFKEIKRNRPMYL